MVGIEDQMVRQRRKVVKEDVPKAVTSTMTQALATGLDATGCLEQDIKWTRGVGLVLVPPLTCFETLVRLVLGSTIFGVLFLLPLSS